MPKTSDKIIFRQQNQVRCILVREKVFYPFCLVMSPSSTSYFPPPLLREGQKPGDFMNPQVIPTCIAFWPGEKEWKLVQKRLCIGTLL
jgi:hypothetical protein